MVPLCKYTKYLISHLEHELLLHHVLAVLDEERLHRLAELHRVLAQLVAVLAQGRVHAAHRPRGDLVADARLALVQQTEGVGERVLRQLPHLLQTVPDGLDAGQCDEEAEDLVRAFEDGEDAAVAHHPLERVVLCVWPRRKERR